MKPSTYLPIIAVAVIVIPITTVYLVQSDGKDAKDEPATVQTQPEQDANTNNKPADNKPADNNPTNNPATNNPTNNKTMSDTSIQTPQKRVITPEAIAKAKNVPATLDNPQGNFTLVAVVEGSDANRRLNQSLQIVGAQRQRLALLSQQFDQTPAASVQQRELIAGQINETRKTLEGNLRFMAQNYAYSLSNNYVLVPHEASLLAVSEEDGETKTELVYEFKNSGSYEDFQKKRDVYLRLKLEQAKAAQEAAKPKKDESAAVLVKDGEAAAVEPGSAASVPESDSAAEQDSKLEPTAEMEEKSKEMKQLYKYDPEKNYQIDFQKTALYARAAR